MELEMINSDIMDRVIDEMNRYDYNSFLDKDIEEALSKDYLSIKDFQALLSPKAMDYLEEIAQKAKTFRERYFGNSVYMFTPLYISNYCDNYCVYCGFNSHNKIKRAKLDLEQIEQELKEIAKSGLEEILILTGESEKYSNIEYIGEACKLARKYFNNVGIEIYPVNVKDYEYLNSCGAESTRENSNFRDNIIKIAATKISAGVDTGIGAHTNCSNKKGDEQFEIADRRTVAQIFEIIKKEELQPVMNDYIYLKDSDIYGKK